MRVGELIKALQQYPDDCYVMMTFEGFEQDYWVDKVSRDGKFVTLAFDGKVEFSDLAGACDVLDIDGLTQRQIDAADDMVKAEMWAIREAQAI